MIKISDEVFHCAYLFQLGQMTEIVGISIKEGIELNNKLGPGNIPLTEIVII
jgi:hypothetical protein